METELVFKEESYRIIGACFEVYKEKGNGFLEAVNQRFVNQFSRASRNALPRDPRVS